MPTAPSKTPRAPQPRPAPLARRAAITTVYVIELADQVWNVGRFRRANPDKITIDRSGANTAAVKSLIADTSLDIELRQSKYLNNLIEQDHRAIKRRGRPVMGFKTFRSSAAAWVG